jgi:hypothetical protein
MKPHTVLVLSCTSLVSRIAHHFSVSVLREYVFKLRNERSAIRGEAIALKSYLISTHLDLSTLLSLSEIIPRAIYFVDSIRPQNIKRYLRLDQ